MKDQKFSYITQESAEADPEVRATVDRLIAFVEKEIIPNLENADITIKDSRVVVVYGSYTLTFSTEYHKSAPADLRLKLQRGQGCSGFKVKAKHQEGGIVRSDFQRELAIKWHELHDAVRETVRPKNNFTNQIDFVKSLMVA